MIWASAWPFRCENRKLVPINIPAAKISIEKNSSATKAVILGLAQYFAIKPSCEYMYMYLHSVADGKCYIAILTVIADQTHINI